MWRRKWTSLTWLFAVNRVVMVFLAIEDMAPYTPAVSHSLLRFIVYVTH